MVPKHGVRLLEDHVGDESVSILDWHLHKQCIIYYLLRSSIDHEDDIAPSSDRDHCVGDNASPSSH